MRQRALTGEPDLEFSTVQRKSQMLTRSLDIHKKKKSLISEQVAE